ncbi:GmrSD restriction endonuclease domain-containing protein [Dactylosporangium sp. CA-092794]|uniref:GmrSD restriction endonuclease domain-containing protein n=1 Tax=Dactylosporangium sp. CA-092794 TaxID=3239929 RepID=UPI003D935238
MPSTFTADPSTLRQLILQPGQGFYVPAYQRDFTWGEDEIDRLFEDLEQGITRATLGGTPSTFLGTVIMVSDRESVMPKHPDALPTTVLQVVDGQQRLSTLLTVFVVLSRFVSADMRWLQQQIDGGTAEDLDEWLLNTLGERRDELLGAIAFKTYSGIDEFNMKPRLIRQASDVWGNDAIHARYESDVAWLLMEATRYRNQNNQHVAIKVPTDRRHLESVLRVITSHIDNLRKDGADVDCDVLTELRFLRDIGMAKALIGSSPAPVAQPELLDDRRKSAARLLVVASFLLNGVLVIDVKAPDEEYAFALFEPLNTTGQPLTALETLKPLVVRSEGGNTDYSTSPSAAAFSRVESYFPSSMKADGRGKSIADMLTAFALAETGRKLSRTLLDQRRYLRSEFQSVAPPNGHITTARDFVGQLADVSAFICDVWPRSGPSPLMSLGSDLDRLCLEVLRSTNHTVVLALLARYYSVWADSQSLHSRDEFMSVLRAVTAFWVLWRTSRATTRGIDDVHRKLMATGHSETGLPAMARRASGVSGSVPPAAEIRAALRNVLSVRGNIPSMAAWVTEVTKQPLYQTSKQLAKFVLLCAHDDRVEDHVAPGLVKRGVSGSFRALTPEVWDSHYSVEHIAPQNPVQGDTSYDLKIYEQGLIDRLGNLTLMPTDLNELIGNKTWAYKKSVYAVLSETDPSARVSHMQQQLPGLALKTKTVLQSASYLPFCDFLGKQDTPLSDAYIAQRGQRLAELAVERLWPMLA